MAEQNKNEVFFKGLNKDYKKLRKRPTAWREYQKELALWDNTVSDGLENERFAAEITEQIKDLLSDGVYLDSAELPEKDEKR